VCEQVMSGDRMPVPVKFPTLVFTARGVTPP